jgi:DNA invertase Pin-like site-specific DNA recombinase
VIKGYARVSTDGQDLATQHELLNAAGATLVFSAKQSGIKTDRAALARLLASLEAGDTVLVTKLDRLARSTRDLLNTLAAIGEAGASFKSLGDPWADTTTPHGRLMPTVLGGLAEFERHLILRVVVLSNRPRIARNEGAITEMHRQHAPTTLDAKLLHKHRLAVEVHV